ncbi:MAG: hypothetical protein HYU66_24450 [Armatimonadetes bacterium]|nr:hypothetical protein [Armatimonadota bacterium]
MTLRIAVWCGWLAAVVVPVSAQVDQRPGPDADFGKNYALGRAVKFQFRMVSAEYRVGCVRIGDKWQESTTKRRLLVAHFSVQNATNQQETLGGHLSFVAVDEDKTSHEGFRGFGVEGDGRSADMVLQPAQRVDAYAVFLVPAKREIAKIIVLPVDNDMPVLRYWLAGKVKPLKPPYADPEDKTGLTPRDEVPGSVGDWLSIGHFDVRFDSLNQAMAELGAMKPPADRVFQVVALSLRNVAPVPITVRRDALETGLKLDDESVVKHTRVIRVKSVADVSTQVPAGEEIELRLVFVVPTEAKPQELRIATCYANGRSELSVPVVLSLVAPAPEPQAGG